MRLDIRFLFVCFLLTVQNLGAVEVERLFEAEVVAKSSSERDRKIAVKSALQSVLTRILAGNNILQDTMVKVMLEDAQRYVVESQYSLETAFIKEGSNAKLMRVLFDEKLVIDTLRLGKKGLWNEIRPETLVWLIIEEKGQQSFFDSDLMPEIDQALELASRKKGLPVLYPIQDLKEKRSLSISDVLSAYSDQLLRISSRYDVVSTLAGRVVKNEECWQAEWTLYFDTKILQWQTQCDAVDNVVLAGFQRVYDKLSKFYAAKPDRFTRLSEVQANFSLN